MRLHGSSWWDDLVQQILAGWTLATWKQTYENGLVFGLQAAYRAKSRSLNELLK